ncbi:MAG: hypothetical protein RI988_3826, partial [Pseudomonadota bacterium]
MTPRHPTPARRWVLWGLVLAVLMAAMGVLAWRHVPGWLHALVEQEGSQALGRRVTLERLEVSVAPLALTLHGLRVAGAGESAVAGVPDVPPQLAATRVHVAMAMASIPARAPVVDDLQVDGLRVRLARVAPGRTDVDDILARLRVPPAGQPGAQAPAEPGPPRFAVHRLRLADGHLQLDDRVVGPSLAVARIGLELDAFSTLDGAQAARARPRLAFTLDGVPVTLTADAAPFAATPQASFEFGLAGALPLARAWAYLPAGLPGQAEGGALRTTLRGHVALPAGQPLQLELRGDAVLDTLAWRMPGPAQPVSWRRLAVEGLHLTLHEQRLAVARVRLEGPRAEAGRDRQGRFWVGGLVQPGVSDRVAAPAGRPTTAAPAAHAAAAASAPGTAAPAWRVSLARVEVADGELGWADAAAPTPVRWRVQALQAAAQPLAWPLAEPVDMEVSARLHTPGLPASAWQARGRWARPALEATLKAEGVRLEALAPYLEGVLRPRASGLLSLDAAVQARTEPSLGVQLRLRRLQGEALQLREPGAPAPAARVSRLTVDDAQLQWPAARIQVGRVRVQAPLLALVRTPDGALDVERWVASSGAVRQAPASQVPATQVPGVGRAAPGAQREPRRPGGPPAAPAWALRVDDLSIDSARLRWRDETPAVRQEDRPLELGFGVPSLRVQGLAWPPGPAPMRVGLRAELEPAAAGDVPGQVEAQASVGLAPPSVRGVVRAERVPLHRVAPYVAAGLPVRVASAELGIQAEIDLTRTDAGVAGHIDGRALLADVLLRSRVAGADVQVGDELLSWQALAVEPVRARWQPGELTAVEIGQVVLSDAYSRLVITERGTFNLVDTMQPEAAAAPAASDARPPAAVPPSSSGSRAAAPPAQAPASSASPDTPPAVAAPATPDGARWPVALTIGETRLVRGRVDFSDRFVKPNYSAALTELEGTLGRFSSEDRELPALQLTGRAAGTAELQVRGSLNPLVVPPVLDLSARATGFELSTISTYAAKYAGYAIERGKLSLDLAYRIDADGRLQARNQVVVNQLTFGEKVDSPDATTLPVRLAIALLTDRNGVIDLDLPISGSINDPQFSVFGLVLKVLGNLIVKAVTAPFAWLAGPGREDLSVVEFRPGTAELATSSAAVLDRVAQALGDRPALRMTVTGVADPASEREAMQAEALMQRLRAEQRRELARAGRALAADAPLPDIGPAERERLLARVYDQTALPDKPRQVLGFVRKLPAPDMEGRLQRAVVVSTDSARELAIRRGLAVREAL